MLSGLYICSDRWPASITHNPNPCSRLLQVPQLRAVMILLPSNLVFLTMFLKTPWNRDDLGWNAKVKKLIVDSITMLLRYCYAPLNMQLLKSALFSNAINAYPYFITRTFNKLKNGLLPHGASLLPRFLFPENQVYDSEDVEDGCFRGHLLLRVSLNLVIRNCISTFFSPGRQTCSPRP